MACVNNIFHSSCNLWWTVTLTVRINTFFSEWLQRLRFLRWKYYIAAKGRETRKSKGVLNNLLNALLSWNPLRSRNGVCIPSRSLQKNLLSRVKFEYTWIKNKTKKNSHYRFDCCNIDYIVRLAWMLVCTPSPKVN